jgi:hypothetical protein
MTYDEIVAAALELPPHDRVRLAERLLASVARPDRMAADDPLWELGTDAVSLDVTDGSVRHDHYLYGPESL